MSDAASHAVFAVERASPHPTGRYLKANPKQDESPYDAFAERVRQNQQKLRAALKAQYDFIVCGSGHPDLSSLAATQEVVLSLGAIHTPKVLMQSGICDEAELRRFGIPVVQHLPGVGKNFQDQVAPRLCLGVSGSSAASEHDG
jgi:hypothetical protein